MKAVAAALTVLMVMPIWLYLLYKILVAIEATDLMWFLYIAYIPATIIANIIHLALQSVTK